jgi:hypothetical protein
MKPVDVNNSTHANPPFQEDGNYRVAHSKLLRAVRQLRNLGARPPRDLLAALLLLHSYVLVKSLAARDDHMGAARMLARVTRSISRCGSGLGLLHCGAGACRMHVALFVSAHVLVSVCVYVCARTHTCVCVCVCVHACTRTICTPARVCAC